METKHTKGKWIRYGRNIYAIGKIGKHDANIFSCTVSNDYLMMTDDELYANAKLIAAAPELLEALIRCHSLLKAQFGKGYEEWIEYQLTESAIKKATE